MFLFLADTKTKWLRAHKNTCIDTERITIEIKLLMSYDVLKTTKRWKITATFSFYTLIKIFASKLETVGKRKRVNEEAWRKRTELAVGHWKPLDRCSVAVVKLLKNNQRHLHLTTSTTSTMSNRVRHFVTTKFLTGVREIVVGSNLLAVILFTTRIVEYLVVSTEFSSKAKKSYS